MVRHITIANVSSSVFAPISFQGGLLIALPRTSAAAYCKDFEREEGLQSWIVGVVEKGDRTARIIDKPRVIEVPTKDTEDQLW